MVFEWLKKNKRDDNCDVSAQDIVKKCSVYYIPCDKIRSNAMRSRNDFNEDKLVLLAYSIRKYGIIEPLCVRTTDDDDIYDFEIIAGERRLRAAKLAELSVVPCIIMSPEQLFSAELSVIENIYSENLNYFEVAAALKRIADHGDESLQDLATRLSMTQNDLLNKAWLLDLNYEERTVLLSANASESLAVAIAKISDINKRSKIIEYLSTTDATESMCMELIESLETTSENDSPKMPRDVSSVIKSISSKIKFLNRRTKRGKIELHNESDGVKLEIYIKY